MATILVIDDAAIFREPITTALEHHGYRAIAAASGLQALKLLESTRPDLIILDLVMPGMDGWEFLKRLRRRPAFADLPVILLTATADRLHVLQARDYRVRDYLLKSQFSLADMLARVARVTGTQPAPASKAPAPARSTPTPVSTASDDSELPEIPEGIRPLTREETIRRIEECTTGKTLAGVVADVVRMAGSPRVGASDLAAVLKRDPVLAARVLQVANTAAFATQKAQITTIDEAVRNVGLSTVRNIAASVGVVEAFAGAGQDGVNMIRCWQHCFAVAGLMDRLVTRTESDAASAYVIGLCHDLAEILLLQSFYPEHQAAVRSAAETGRTLKDELCTWLGMTRHEQSRLVLSKLGLPPAVIAPIQEYLDYEHIGAACGNPLARALDLANKYANGLMLAASAEALVSPVTKAELEEPTLVQNLIISGQELRAEVVTTTSLLAGPGGQSPIMQPLLPAGSARLWYVRGRAFGAFDPLEQALLMLGRPEVHDHLPQHPDDLHGYQAVIVAVGENAPPFSRLAGSANVSRVPVLYLAPDTPGETLPPNVQYVGGAVSLSALHGFISSATERHTQQAAA